MSATRVDLDRICINTIRTLAMDAVERAGSGHPGLPMGAAALAYTVWTRHLRHNPADPAWPDRDRFVLSAGHGSMLLYALLHLTGYDLPLAELKRFRQWGSHTPGHPEHGVTPGVETTTGPLGQGFANGVGMAMAERFLAARFNRPGHTVVDHFTYALVSDGDLMEGVSAEAASLAAHLGLGRLVYLYDSNRISIEGSTELAFTEDVGRRFAAYGWHVQEVADGNDVAAIDEAIATARAEEDRPSLIVCHTHLAYGSPHKHDNASAHGSPLGADEVRATKAALGWPLEPDFLIPDEALAHFRQALARGRAAEDEWRRRRQSWAEAHPDLAAEWDRSASGRLPEGWDADLPRFAAGEGGLATRQASGRVLNAVAPRLPWLLGGSADLAPSTDTLLTGLGDFGPGSYGGRNLHFGVREHAMGAILNGLALHGDVRPFGATFLIFSDYMRPPIRLAALMSLPVVYVFTHDSIALGEDGPTHQPVGQLAALRAIPGLVVLRPADANETAAAWRFALSQWTGPVALALTRQKLPVLRVDPPVERGAYVALDPEGGAAPQVVLLASGSEVSLALEGARRLAAEGVAARVVSVPSLELFAAQDAAYRDEVLPPGVTARLAVEAAGPQPWWRWVGSGGDVLGLERFGASAPGEVVMRELGFTPERVAERARALLGRDRAASGPAAGAAPGRGAADRAGGRR